MILIGDYEIDALVSIAPAYRNEVTMHPVENGAKISDHVIERPLVVTVQGIVSDTPIGLVALNRAEGAVPSADAYAYFQSLLWDKEMITLESGVYPPFEGMLLTTLDAPKNATTGASFRFTAIFQQITLATVNTRKRQTLVALPGVKRKVDKGNADAAEEEADSQTQTTGNPKGESHAITVLKKGDKALDAIKGLF